MNYDFIFAKEFAECVEVKKQEDTKSPSRFTHCSSARHHKNSCLNIGPFVSSYRFNGFVNL